VQQLNSQRKGGRHGQNGIRKQKVNGGLMDQLLTAQDAANLLGVKLATIRKLTHLRRLPCVRPTGARAVRYSRLALEKLIRQRTQPALAEAA
jgi:excisionase family DNA binding protein